MIYTFELVYKVYTFVFDFIRFIYLFLSFSYIAEGHTLIVRTPSRTPSRTPLRIPLWTHLYEHLYAHQETCAPRATLVCAKVFRKDVFVKAHNTVQGSTKALGDNCDASDKCDIYFYVLFRMLCFKYASYIVTFI